MESFKKEEVLPSNLYERLTVKEEFQQIQKKLNQNDKLSNHDWNYLLPRLYLIACYYASTEEKMTLKEKLICLHNKLTMATNEKWSPIYTECYKLSEALTSFEKEVEINRDLFFGKDIVSSTFDEEDLKILLSQHREASIFHQNKEAYIKEFMESQIGEISSNAKLYIHAYNSAYAMERELVKQYPEKSKKKVYFFVKR